VDISYQQENYQMVNTIYSGGKLPYTQGRVDYSELWSKTAKEHFELDAEEKNRFEILDCHNLQAKNTIFKGIKRIQLNEFVYVIFKASNPLKIPIKMTDLTILTESGEAIEIQQQVKIPPLSEETV